MDTKDLPKWHPWHGKNRVWLRFKGVVLFPLSLLWRFCIRIPAVHRWLATIARQWYEENWATGNIRRAAFAAVAMRQQFPEDPEWKARLGCIYVAHGDYGKGAEWFNTLFEAGHYSEAALISESMTRYAADKAASWYRHGIALQRLGEQERAIGAFREALQRKPSYADAYFGLGASLLELKNVSEARRAFFRSAIMDPSREYTLAGIERTFSGEKLPLPVVLFMRPRVAAAKVFKLFAVAGEKAKREISEWARAATQRPTDAYVAHMIVTGHEVAASELVAGFRRFIVGPVLNVGCGTGEQTLWASIVLGDEQKSRGHAGDRFVSITVDRRSGRPVSVQGEFTIANLDINPAMLEFTGNAILHLFDEPGRFRWIFMQGDITRMRPATSYRTVVASYLFHWLGDGLAPAIRNIAACLAPGGHLIVLGEFPLVYTPSPFLDGTTTIHGTPTPIPFEEIERLCREAGLELAERKDVEIPTLEKECRHPMFGAVFKKKG